MLSTILIIAAVILLLVLLVPIGFALYQRIKPKPPERPAAPSRPAPPPLRAPEQKAAVPDLNAAPAPAPAPLPKTDKVAPVSAAEAADATRMKAPAAPANESTRPLQPGGEPSGTEMLEWYGMLRCTDGPLEGQHFIVEANGIYIGRDASMSQIVINDSRVSKRHLRILPRNGKVWAIDEGSTNGTFLGGPTGERITEHQLKRGDTLVLAENAATFVYQI